MVVSGVLELVVEVCAKRVIVSMSFNLDKSREDSKRELTGLGLGGRVVGEGNVEGSGSSQAHGPAVPGLPSSP